MSKVPTLDAWLSTVKEVRGPNSETLKYPKEVREAIHRFLELKVSGETKASLSQFRDDYLEPNFNYTLTVCSLKRYIKLHEKALWEKLKNNDR